MGPEAAIAHYSKRELVDKAFRGAASHVAFYCHVCTKRIQVRKTETNFRQRRWNAIGDESRNFERWSSGEEYWGSYLGLSGLESMALTTRLPQPNVFWNIHLQNTE
ncbi:hypothetical protein TNCV_1406911 [Trichonephila clavipes]|nr:hypothetical protein TNCV_1406911 [Trichonephila clavipes]